MKNFSLLILMVICALQLVAQDVGVKNVFVLDKTGSPVSGDSIVLNDTVQLAVDFHNFGSGLIGTNDSVAIGLSASGLFVGNFGLFPVAVNIVPGQTKQLIMKKDLTFPIMGTAKVCAWTTYNPNGGDPNKTNDTACKTFTVWSPTGVLVSSFSPASGYRGTEITINGNNFSPTAANNIVRIGTIKATIVSATATEIKATIPQNATSNFISVETGGKTSISSNQFDVIIPEINSFAPGKGKPGDTVKIEGKNILSQPKVEFNGLSATVTKHANDSVWAIVPNNATSGKVKYDFTITQIESKTDFLVTDSAGNVLNIVNVAPANQNINFFNNTIKYTTAQAETMVEMNIIDLTGNLVLKTEKSVENGEVEYDISHLNAGIFIAIIGKSYLKFVKD